MAIAPKGSMIKRIMCMKYHDAFKNNNYPTWAANKIIKVLRESNIRWIRERMWEEMFYANRLR